MRLTPSMRAQEPATPVQHAVIRAALEGHWAVQPDGDHARIGEGTRRAAESPQRETHTVNVSAGVGSCPPRSSKRTAPTCRSRSTWPRREVQTAACWKREPAD